MRQLYSQANKQQDKKKEILGSFSSSNVTVVIITKNSFSG